jgi:hypothetical protein
MPGRFRSDGDQVIKRMILQSIENCSVCGRQLREEDLKVLGHQKDTWFLMVICHNCNTQGLISVQVKEDAGDSVVSETYSDLTDEEIARFATGKAVSPEDVGEMNLFLEGFNGDFIALFGKSI